MNIQAMLEIFQIFIFCQNYTCIGFVYKPSGVQNIVVIHFIKIVQGVRSNIYDFTIELACGLSAYETQFYN